MRKSWGKWGHFSVESAIERFMAKTAKQENGCINWVGSKGSHGRYGSVGIAGKIMLAHRAIWTLSNGIEPPNGLYVLHKCDNGMCVNLEHLFLGTQEDNVLDMERKGRSFHPRHEKHGRAKLTFEKIEAARKRVLNGEFIKNIAKEYGVHRRTLSHAINGKSWVTK